MGVTCIPRILCSHICFPTLISPSGCNFLEVRLLV